jgi:hypothetical protein
VGLRTRGWAMEKNKSYPLLVENMVYEGVPAGALLHCARVLYWEVRVGLGQGRVMGG